MRLFLFTFLLVLSGCDAPAVAGHNRGAQPLTTCEVQAPAGVTGLVAHRDGVVFQRSSTPSGLLLDRASGVGCELSVGEGAPIAVSELLDVDDQGNIFAFPAEGRQGEISTMLPGERRNSMVAKVDSSGQVTRLLGAGRGIWSFGVSPEGGSLWMTACGPNGIFTMAGMEPAMKPPETLWEQRPSVLTGNGTFWSVGLRTCLPAAAMSPDCGLALVRSTAEGSRELGITVVDFGSGLEEASLARCGADVCGVYGSAVIVWDDEGKVLRTIVLGDLSATPSEKIAHVSGNQHGVYVLLHGEAGSRIVFVPVRG